MKSSKLKYKFIVPTLIIITCLLAMNLVWNYSAQKKQAQNIMVEKAQVLTEQLDATWEFMSVNQDVINTDRDGVLNFKGLHCSIVGMSIGALFSQKTDYTIRYVREVPRNIVNLPDEFELAALKKFETEPNLTQYWQIANYKDEEMFRYLEPMRVDKSCLECHGEPAGAIDISGFPKDGMKIGDLVGAISIVAPTDIYTANIRNNLILDGIFFLLLMVVCMVTLYFFMTRLVITPLGKLEKAVRQVGDGNLDVDLQDVSGEGEIKELADLFDNMAKQLQSLYCDLENKVELRTTQLGAANEILKQQQRQLQDSNLRLQKDNEYKSDFLAMVSHELKTPLTSIILFLDILLTENAVSSPPHADILAEVKLNSQRLLSMINNILYMAKIEAGRSELVVDMVDLVDILNNVETLILPQAKAKNITLATSIGRDVPLIAGDYEKLRCIVENLVGNAIKFTPNDGTINVDIFLQDDYLNIAVSDSGIGIAEKDLDKIFDKFIQSDSSSSRPYNGSGLGLALVKEFTELHGGTVQVTSEYGQGSRFTAKFPLERILWRYDQ